MLHWQGSWYRLWIVGQVLGYERNDTDTFMFEGCYDAFKEC